MNGDDNLASCHIVATTGNDKGQGSAMNVQSGKIGKASRNMLVMMMIFTIAVLGSLTPARTALAFDPAPPDPQDTIIKQVLAETGAEFGWDEGSSFYGQPAYEGAERIYYCPKVWGPRMMYDFEGDEMVPIPGAAYGLDTPMLQGETVWETLPMKITAYPTEKAAATAIAEGIALCSSMTGFKATTFHNSPAIVTSISSLGGKTIEWQTGRFYFTAGLSIDIDISFDDIAEALYANAVKYGLINGDGGIPAQDSDGDGATDDVDKCPGTPVGVAVDASGCPLAAEMTLTLSTNKKVYSAEETVIIQGSVSDAQGKVATADLLIDVNGKQISATTDASGNYQCEFVIPPEVTQAIYSVSATASALDYPSVSNNVSFVVGEIGMHLEENPTTGEPFIGVTADGTSSLAISIFLPGCSNVKIVRPDIGELEGNALSAAGAVALDSTGAANIDYLPPDYITKDQLTRKIDVHQSNATVWATEVPLTLTYTDPSEQEKKIEANILVCRPPVMFVHGFLGATATWGKMSSYLRGEKFDTYLGNYGATDQSIEGLSRILRNDIRKQKLDYLNSNIKLEKVDAIGHSMGGLISRYYSHGLTDYDGDIRKLIMVGTPNHGVSWTKKIIGNIGAAWYQTHRIPAQQLYSESSFMKALNSGERTGAHLDPDIQYANMYGMPDDWVVDATSAYLNGVQSVSVSDVKHSADIPGVPHVAITEYLKTWEQVKSWLSDDIYRPQLRGYHAEVSRYWGDVYLIDYDSSGSHESKLTSSPMQFDSWQSLRTAKDSKAIVHLVIDDVPWGVIFLDPESQIFLGNCSPQLVEVRLREGSATFRTKKDGHFTVPMNIGRSEGGEWWTYSPDAVVTGLDTEFAVTSGENIEVHCLKGELVVDTGGTTEQGTLLSTNASVAVTGDEVATIDPVSQDDFWWSSEDDGFLDSTSGGFLNTIARYLDSFFDWILSPFDR